MDEYLFAAIVRPLCSGRRRVVVYHTVKGVTLRQSMTILIESYISGQRLLPEDNDLWDWQLSNASKCILNVNVSLQTPDNQTLTSTSKENGRFILAVPNPVVTGDYTCRVENSSYTSVCLPRSSPLLRGATIFVDGCNEGSAVSKATEKDLREKVQTLKKEKTLLGDLWQSVRVAVPDFDKLSKCLSLSHIVSLVVQTVILLCSLCFIRRWYFEMTMNQCHLLPLVFATIFIHQNVPFYKEIT